VLADDAATRRWSGSMRTLYDRADAVDWIRSRLARRTDWAVVEAGNGVLAGRVGLHHHDAEEPGPARSATGSARRSAAAGSSAVRSRPRWRTPFAPAPDGLGRNR